MSGLQITMDVRAYRERPVSSDSSRSSARGQRVAVQSPKGKTQAAKGTAQALWDYLLTQSVEKT
jgi:hypothetical protein